MYLALGKGEILCEVLRSLSLAASTQVDGLDLFRYSEPVVDGVSSFDLSNISLV